MPSLRKMMVDDGDKMPHVGELLYKIMLQKHITQAELARRLNISDVGVMRYLKQPTLHAALLWKLSKILGHNMLADLADAHPVKKNDADNEELKDLKKELEIYKKIVEGKMAK